MLEADDRNDVLSWSEKQLGPQAGLVSVLQVEEPAPAGQVEKSGTGIGQQDDQSLEWYRTAELCNRKATVH